MDTSKLGHPLVCNELRRRQPLHPINFLLPEHFPILTLELAEGNYLIDSTKACYKCLLNE